MLLTTDDDTRTVDNTFLGPKGYLLPFEARFIAYGIGAGVAVTVRLLESRLGVPITSVAWAAVTVVTVAMTTRKLGRYVTFEKPVRVHARIFWQELGAPRARTKGEHATLIPAAVRVDPVPWRTRAARRVEAVVAWLRVPVLA